MSATRRSNQPPPGKAYTKQYTVQYAKEERFTGPSGEQVRTNWPVIGRAFQTTNKGNPIIIQLDALPLSSCWDGKRIFLYPIEGDPDDTRPSQPYVGEDLPF